MLDINLIREKTDEVKKGLLKKIKEVDLESIISFDDKRKELGKENDELKSERNKFSKTKPTPEIIEKMKEVGEKIKKLDEELRVVEEELNNRLAVLPNLPDEDVVAGGKENNEIIRTWGKKPEFGFEPKDHVELVESLNLVDYKRGVKLGGNGYWIYKGDGAILEWALLNYFVEEHLKDGYEMILPPHILNYECGYTAGQFPKFVDDVFRLKDENDKMQFLVPTAETALVNYHRDEILNEEELPKKYFAYTPCYRQEAGAYRKEERGMIRGHQFNKVEMVQFVKQSESENALEELIEKAERLMQGLGLHYQVSKLAAEDCSASMAKTYDIEVWIPSMNVYKEVSSASNARDYQARRGNMKYKISDGKKEFLHTLNASGLATSRVLPAMVEQLQQEDGSILVPEVLRKWVGKELLNAR